MSQDDQQPDPPDAYDASDDASDDAPPRPRPDRRRRLGYYFPQRQIIAIFGLLIALVAVLGMRTSCAAGVGNLFRAMDTPDGGVPPGQGTGLAPPRDTPLQATPGNAPVATRPMSQASADAGPFDAGS